MKLQFNFQNPKIRWSKISMKMLKSKSRSRVNKFCWWMTKSLISKPLRSFCSTNWRLMLRQYALEQQVVSKLYKSFRKTWLSTSTKSQVSSWFLWTTRCLVWMALKLPTTSGKAYSLNSLTNQLLLLWQVTQTKSTSKIPLIQAWTWCLLRHLFQRKRCLT